MEVFSNREIATGVWLIVFALWVLRHESVRASTRRLWDSFLHPKIIVPVILLVLYTVGAVWTMHRVDFWTPDLLKDTILWFVLGGAVMVFRFGTSRPDEHLLRAVLTETAKLVLVIEFLVATYTFPLVAEFMLVPAMGVVVVINAVAETDEKYHSVAKLTTALIVIFGLAVLTSVTLRLIEGFSQLNGTEVVRQILLAPVLSLLLTPFIFLLQLYVNYESLFVRLKIGAEKPRNVRSYARRRLMWRFKLSPRRVRAFLGANAHQLMTVRTVEDVDRLLDGEERMPEQSDDSGVTEEPITG